GDSQLGAGAWTQDEIAEIDMSRWMAKSIAWVIHRDGQRLRMDAYLHKDLHLIVGAIASRLHPAQWNDQASPVNAEPAPDQDGVQAVEMPAAAAPASESRVEA